MNLLEEHTEDELRLIDANLLPLNKKMWTFSRGARELQEYKDALGNINIREKYNYIWTNDNREILDFSREFTFLDDSGVPLFDPIDTTPDKNSLLIDEINESIRRRQIRYLRTATKALEEGANSLPQSVDQLTLNHLMSIQAVHPNYNTPELYNKYRQGLLNAALGLNYLLNHYSTEILNYENFGTMDFENAILNETDITALSVLDATLRSPDSKFPNGLTGRQSILYQLTGVIP